MKASRLLLLLFGSTTTAALDSVLQKRSPPSAVGKSSSRPQAKIVDRVHETSRRTDVMPTALKPTLKRANSAPAHQFPAHHQIPDPKAEEAHKEAEARAKTAHKLTRESEKLAKGSINNLKIAAQNEGSFETKKQTTAMITILKASQANTEMLLKKAYDNAGESSLAAGKWNRYDRNQRKGRAQQDKVSAEFADINRMGAAVDAQYVPGAARDETPQAASVANQKARTARKELPHLTRVADSAQARYRKSRANGGKDTDSDSD